jgi:sugar phosphate isomerase/epimerase
MEDLRRRRISLHQVTVRDLSPADLIRTAADLGCEHVCLFTQGAGGAVEFPVVADDDLAELRRLMDGVGVSMLGATSFPLAPATNVAAYEAGIARAAALGGAIANVRILDVDRGRSADNLARLGALAQGYGLAPTIEFTGFDAPEILDRTLDVIREAGCGKISMDPLHVVRTRTPIAALKALDPELIGYVQLCDGPLVATREDYAREGAYDRLPPGQGEFPLLDFLDATPPGAPLSIETPQEGALRRGVGAAERAWRAVEGARRVLETAAARTAP